jgi:hypothetical protein
MEKMKNNPTRANQKAFNGGTAGKENVASTYLSLSSDFRVMWQMPYTAIAPSSPFFAKRFFRQLNHWKAHVSLPSTLGHPINPRRPKRDTASF